MKRKKLLNHLIIEINPTRLILIKSKPGAAIIESIQKGAEPLLASYLNLVDSTTLFPEAFFDRKIVEITRILNTFESITLGEMDSLRLLKRTDTKYIFHQSMLPEVLQGLAQDYAVLSVDGIRLQPYATRYFDTPDFKLYRQHHNGQRDRYKLRVRSYVQTGLDVLEVKRKDNQDRTRKSLLPGVSLPLENSPEISSFLAGSFPMNEEMLVPKLTNGFYRIALASRSQRERLSLDLAIHFNTPGNQFSLPGVLVAEVKQPRFSSRSVFVQKMRQMGCRPICFSKYCVGAALAYSHLNRNAFKPLLLSLQNLILQGVTP